MKVLVCGCFHGKLHKNIIKAAKSCNFILSTGDFGGSETLRNFMFKNFGDDYKTKLGKKRMRMYHLEDYNSGKKIIQKLNALGKQTYTIDGNWDFTSTADTNNDYGLKFVSYVKIIKKTKNVLFMNKKIRNIQGLKIYPHGGLMLASIYHEKFFSHDKFRTRMYKKWHTEQKTQLFKQHSKDLDILLAHCPPYGYFDKVKFKGHNPMNGKHVGFRPYNEYIVKYKPKLFICGHMHEHQGIAKLGKTIILSHGPAQNGKAAIVEYVNGKFKIRLIK